MDLKTLFGSLLLAAVPIGLLIALGATVADGPPWGAAAAVVCLPIGGYAWKSARRSRIQVPNRMGGMSLIAVAFIMPLLANAPNAVVIPFLALDGGFVLAAMIELLVRIWRPHS